MKFESVLDESFEYGPAMNLKTLSLKVKQMKNRSSALKWAQREIRNLLQHIRSGSGATVHNKLNDISAMMSALNIYLDDESSEALKNIAEKEYQKVLQNIRRRSR